MEDDAAPSAGKHSRRKFLKVAGVSVLGAGLALSVGVPLVRDATRTVPPRVPATPTGDLRIDHVTVIDPRDGSRREDASILVRGGRIVDVSPLPAGPPDPTVQTIDGAGRFAVPGYNNMHTHAIQAERAPLLMATMLAEGVTGMRQMLGSPDLLSYRAEGRLPLGVRSPQLLAMPGEILTPFNAGSVDAVRAAIDTQYEAGADFVKMILTDRDVFFAAVDHAHSRGLPIAGHLPESVLPSEAAKAGFDCVEHLGASNGVWVESSSRSADLWAKDDTGLPVPGWVAGLPFAEDIFNARSAKTLINPAAFDPPEKAAFMDEAVGSFDEARARELAVTFRENGTWQSPTLVRLRTQYLMDEPAYQDDPWLGRMSASARTDYEDVLATFRGLPEATRTAYRHTYDTAVRFTGILAEERVPLLVATDGQGKVPGQWMQLEFQELAKAGMTPQEILRACTTAPAEFLGRSATMGVIAPGADADLLLLASDPLDHVDNLASITAVVRAGHHATAAELQEAVEELAQASIPDARAFADAASLTCHC
jgi:imidazolonepropionase-like amidohydrolase